MVDLVRVIDKDNRIVLMNKNMKETMGDEIGSICTGVYNGVRCCEECLCDKTIKENKTFNKYRTMDGKTYNVVASPILDENGKPIAAVEIYRDVTEEQRLTNEIIMLNDKFKSDIKLARMVQAALITDMPQIDNLEFEAIYCPCESLGGDFYDVFFIDKQRTAFYMADVSGHGVMASMLTAYMKEAVRSALIRQQSPAKALKNLLKSFRSLGLAESIYITIFLAVANIETGEVKYCNAGLNTLPLVFSNSQVVELFSPGMPLSKWDMKDNYEDSVFTMQVGDKMMLYTDGLTEEKSLGYSEQMLKKFLVEYDKETNNLSSICNRLINIQRKDDAAVMVLSRIK
jgi:sigma-B regulation protein RsbU (phosphoserine phosphatase)